jgi:hypothetical protein
MMKFFSFFQVFKKVNSKSLYSQVPKMRLKRPADKALDSQSGKEEGSELIKYSFAKACAMN